MHCFRGTAGFMRLSSKDRIQSLIKDKAEVYVSQYLRDLASSSDRLEFENTTSFSNPFEFINNSF